MRKVFNGMKFVAGKYDLPSVQEMVGKHIDMLNTAQCKYMRTEDPETLRIAHEVLKDNQFLKENILGTPNQSVSETESLKVKICDIRKYPNEQALYRKWKNLGRQRVVAIGGPAATDQTMLSCMIPSIRNTHDIHFYCRNYIESNLLHSASQSHARHGNALNADPVLCGRNLLPLMLKRLLIKPTVDDVFRSDYVKVDVKFNNPRYFSQYVQNQINGIVQIIKSKLGMMTEHDMNRLESVTSQEIQSIIEKELNVEYRSNRKADKKDSMAIHLIFSEKSLHEVQNEQKQFAAFKELKWSELTKEEIQKLFPHAEGILTAFRYHGDYSNNFDLYNLSKLKTKEMGAVWEEDKTLQSVFLDSNASGQPYVCGISFTDGKFVPTHKVHLTLGYKASYEYEDSNLKPLTSFNVPATGLSTTMILKKTDKIKEMLEGRGRAMEIAIVNSHWTIIAQNDEYMVIRATGGGNTGSEEYMPSYFLNVCANTKKIFGEAFMGIVSAYGCSRAVNYKNSTQFAELADGLIVSYGKGGTGNTKRASEAYKGLKYLGFQKELTEFFNKKEIDRVPVPQTIDMICEKSSKVDLFYSNKKATKKFMAL